MLDTSYERAVTPPSDEMTREQWEDRHEALRRLQRAQTLGDALAEVMPYLIWQGRAAAADPREPADVIEQVRVVAWSLLELVEITRPEGLQLESIDWTDSRLRTGRSPMTTEELTAVRTEHVKWYMSNGDEGERAILCGADLGGANLRDADLRDADLRGADLCRANLCGAKLCDADLGRANLSGANLDGADLRGADLRGADLRGADLGGADLRDAYLDGADLRGADLGGADLFGAHLDGAVLAEITRSVDTGDLAPRGAE